MTRIGNYTHKPGTLRSIKSAITRAKNRRDWDAVIQIVNTAEEMFRGLGYPECWSDFARHRDDAEAELRTL